MGEQILFSLENNISEQSGRGERDFVSKRPVYDRTYIAKLIIDFVQKFKTHICKEISEGKVLNFHEFEKASLCLYDFLEVEYNPNCANCVNVEGIIVVVKELEHKFGGIDLINSLITSILQKPGCPTCSSFYKKKDKLYYPEIVSCRSRKGDYSYEVRMKEPRNRKHTKTHRQGVTEECYNLFARTWSTCDEPLKCSLCSFIKSIEEVHFFQAIKESYRPRLTLGEHSFRTHPTGALADFFFKMKKYGWLSYINNFERKLWPAMVGQSRWVNLYQAKRKKDLPLDKLMACCKGEPMSATDNWLCHRVDLAFLSVGFVRSPDVRNLRHIMKSSVLTLGKFDYVGLLDMYAQNCEILGNELFEHGPGRYFNDPIVAQGLFDDIKGVPELLKKIESILPDATTMKDYSVVMAKVGSLCSMLEGLMNSTFLKIVIVALVFCLFYKTAKNLMTLATGLYGACKGSFDSIRINSLVDVLEKAEEANKIVAQGFADVFTPIMEVVISMFANVKDVQWPKINAMLNSCKSMGDMAKTLITNLKKVVDIIGYALTGEHVFLEMQHMDEFKQHLAKMNSLIESPDIMERMAQDTNLCQDIIMTYHKAYGIYFRALAVSDLNVATRNFYRDNINAMKNIRDTANSHLAKTERKNEAIVVLLQGKPEQGKSLLCELLTSKVYAAMRKQFPDDPKFLMPYNKSQMWTKPKGTEYWDGYEKQFAVVIDDLFQVNDKDKRAEEAVDIIHMVGPSPLNLNMAKLENKGTTYFNSELVFITSNYNWRDPFNIEDIGALTRRMHIPLEVTLLEKLDGSDLHPSEIDKCWELTVVDLPKKSPRSFLGVKVGDKLKFSDLARIVIDALIKNRLNMTPNDFATKIDWDGPGLPISNDLVTHLSKAPKPDDSSSSTEEITMNDKIIGQSWWKYWFGPKPVHDKTLEHAMEIRRKQTELDPKIVDYLVSIGNLDRSPIKKLDCGASQFISITNRDWTHWWLPKNPILTCKHPECAAIVEIESKRRQLESESLIDDSHWVANFWGLRNSATESFKEDSVFSKHFGFLVFYTYLVEKSLKFGEFTTGLSSIERIHATRSLNSKSFRTVLGLVTKNIMEGDLTNEIVLGALKHCTIELLQSEDKLDAETVADLVRILALKDIEARPSSIYAAGFDQHFDRNEYDVMNTGSFLRNYWKVKYEGTEKIMLSEDICTYFPFMNAYSCRPAVTVRTIRNFDPERVRFEALTIDTFYAARMKLRAGYDFLCSKNWFNLTMSIATVSLLTLSGFFFTMSVIKLVVFAYNKCFGESNAPKVKAESLNEATINDWIKKSTHDKLMITAQSVGSAQERLSMMNLVARNTLVCKLMFSDGSCEHTKCFFVDDRNFFVPRHTLTDRLITSIFIVNNVKDVSGWTVNSHEFSITDFSESEIPRDLVLVTLLKKAAHNCKSLIKYIRSKAEKNPRPCVSRIASDVKGDVINTTMTTPAYAQSVRLKTGNVFKDYEVEIEDFAIVEGSPGTSGDCMTPYMSVSTSANDTFVEGLHIGSKYSGKGSGIYCPIYKEDFVSLAQSWVSYKQIKRYFAVGSCSTRIIPGARPIAELTKSAHIVTETTFHPTIFGEVLNKDGTEMLAPIGGQYDMAPAALKPFKNDEGVVISPLNKAANKYVIAHSGKPAWFDKAMQDSWPLIEEFADMSEFEYKDCTLVDGVIGNPEKGFDSLKDSKSPGFPYVLEGIKRKQLMNVEQRWVSPRLEEDILEVVRTCNKGKAPAYVGMSQLKDELRPIDKVKAGASRLFDMGPLAIICACRMACLAWIEHAKSRFHRGFSMVGINCHSFDWAIFAMYVLQHPNKIGGDFSCYDMTLKCWFVEYFARLMWQTISKHRRKTEYFSTWESFHCIVQSCVNPFIIRGRYLHQRCHSNSSGNWFTSVYNSFVNHCLFSLFWTMNCPDPSLRMRDHVAYGVYGDDNIGSVSDRVKSWFNNRTLGCWLRCFDMIFTNPSKKAHDDDFLAEEDIVFLSRRFVFRDGYWWAPLELTSIYGMLHWNRRVKKAMKDKGVTEEQQLQVNIDTACRELIHHGRGVYEQVTREVETRCREVGSEGFVVRSFDYWMNEFAHTF
jgi:hypothetical protein